MKFDSLMLWLFLSLVCQVFFASSANSKENAGPKLKTLGYCAEASELAAGGYALWQETHKELTEAEAEIKNGVPPAKLAKKLGQCVIKARILSRNCGPLIAMGEPSGIDLKFRVQALDNRLTFIGRSDYGKRLRPLAKQQYDANRHRIFGFAWENSKVTREKRFRKGRKTIECITGFGKRIWIFPASQISAVIVPSDRTS